MIRGMSVLPIASVGLPRTRGDDPDSDGIVQSDDAFAPHVRG